MLAELALAGAVMAATAPADDRAATANGNRQYAALTARGGAQGWTVLPNGLRWRRIKCDGSPRPIPRAMR